MHHARVDPTLCMLYPGDVGGERMRLGAVLEVAQRERARGHVTLLVVARHKKATCMHRVILQYTWL